MFHLFSCRILRFNNDKMLLFNSLNYSIFLVSVEKVMSFLLIYYRLCPSFKWWKVNAARTTSSWTDSLFGELITTQLWVAGSGGAQTRNALPVCTWIMNCLFCREARANTIIRLYHVKGSIWKKWHLWTHPFLPILLPVPALLRKILTRWQMETLAYLWCLKMAKQSTNSCRSQNVLVVPTLGSDESVKRSCRLSRILLKEPIIWLKIVNFPWISVSNIFI